MYFVTFLSLIVLLILIFLVLFAIYPVKAAAVFNSEQQPDIHVMVSWLNPFLKGFITRHGGQTALIIKLFDKRIYKKVLTKENQSGLRLQRRSYTDNIKLVRSLKVKNAKLYASYGFTDPAVTGIICGLVGIISESINFDEIYNNADFTADLSYFNISAEADINAAVSLMRALKINVPHANMQVLRENR